MRNSIKPTNYIPYQPGFEQRTQYQSFVIPSGHPLFGIVSDFYQFDSVADFSEISVIPDGCIDMLFRYFNFGVVKTLEGFHLKKVIIPVSQPGIAFGVRFAPGGLTSLIRINSSDLIQREIPLFDILKKDPLLDQMDYCSNFDERISIISKYLLSRIDRSSESAGIVRYCTEKIVASQGNVLIGELSRDTGYTNRYLRALYHQHIGISPKEFCEIIQFQTSLLQFIHLLNEQKAFSLCDLAVEAGYYDQSHMNKCYQKMVGCLPQKFYCEMRK